MIVIRSLFQNRMQIFVCRRCFNAWLSHALFKWWKNISKIKKLVENEKMVQVVRSASNWSVGISVTEESIQQAYINMIRDAQHYVLIEVVKNIGFTTMCKIIIMLHRINFSFPWSKAPTCQIWFARRCTIALWKHTSEYWLFWPIIFIWNLLKIEWTKIFAFTFSCLCCRRLKANWARRRWPAICCKILSFSPTTQSAKAATRC